MVSAGRGPLSAMTSAGRGSTFGVDNCLESHKPVEISDLRLLSDSGTAGGYLESNPMLKARCRAAERPEKED